MDTNPRVSPDLYASPMIVSHKILHGVLQLPYVTPQDCLESRETCHLIIQAMTPAEAIIAACRWHQLPDSVPALLLGITPQRVTQIMRQLKQRLVTLYPHLRVTVEGRRHTSQI